MSRITWQVCALATLLCSIDLSASGTGLAAFGDPSPAAKEGTGARELVRFHRTGGLLVGRPATGTIELITVRTSPAVNTLTLILWERREADGSAMVRMTAPARVHDELMGLTAFVSVQRAPAWAAVARDGAWVRLPLQEMPSDGPDHMVALSIAEPGVLLLRGEAVGPEARLPPADPAAFASATRAARAGWHILWPALALLLAFIVSRRQHGRAAGG